MVPRERAQGNSDAASVPAKSNAGEYVFLQRAFLGNLKIQSSSLSRGQPVGLLSVRTPRDPQGQRQREV